MRWGGGKQRTWRHPAALITIGLTIAAALLGWLGRESVPPGDVHASVPPPAPVAAPAPPPAAPHAEAPPAHVPSNVVVPYVAPPKLKAVTAVGTEAAEEYRRRARYPRSAQPLSDGEPDPIVRDREVSAVESHGRNGAEPTLRVFPAAMGFESPEPAVVYAELTTR